MNPDSRGKHPDGRRYNEHSEMRRDGGGEDREQERSERPRYNQPRDGGEQRDFRGGFNPRGGPGGYDRGGYGGGGFRSRPRGEYRGGFNGGPPRDNDPEGGRSRFHGGYDSFRGEGGPGMRGGRGNLRGGRGGRGGMYHNDPEGSGPMHRISERGGFNRDDDMGRRGGMQPYRGRGYGEDSGRPMRGFGMDDRRGGFNPDEGKSNHVIKTKSRGGLGSSTGAPDQAPE